jgi:hypothetical protein
VICVNKMYSLRVDICTDTFLDSSLSQIFTGNVNQNMDPFPSSDSTPIAPPISFTSCRDMERPSPVPPNLRVEELSAC